MNKEDTQAINDIQGTAGMRVIKYSVEQKMKKLDSVRGVLKDGMVAEQTLAKQLAYELLEEFFNELCLVIKPQGDIKKTYE